TCYIDQNNNVELQKSVNFMFVWYRLSVLAIANLSDVLPSSKSVAPANSTWNTRGWTVQEFLAPNIVLSYQAEWTLYIDDRSSSHKESFATMQVLERSISINKQMLIGRPTWLTFLLIRPWNRQELPLIIILWRRSRIWLLFMIGWSSGRWK
ncbi:uncharacterized protein HD556DRAFT_1226766, partial [Suillus plorans]